MKRTATVFCCFLFLALAGFAQAGKNPDAPTAEQVNRMVQLLDMKAQIAATSASMRQQMQPIMVDELHKRLPDAPPEAVDELLTAYNDMFNGMYESFSTDEMQATLVAVYQQHLTRAEADAVIAFYSSREGQSFLKKSPVIGTELMRTVFPKLKARMEELNKQFSTRIEEIRKKYQLEETHK